jgi:three-Cys-motif partner protein
VQPGTKCHNSISRDAAVTKYREKYQWEWGSLPPTIDPHSVVKHDLTRDYLARYIQVLLSNPNIDLLTLSIVDGFAGGGEYQSLNNRNFQDGSPLIAIQTVAEAEARLNIGREKRRRVDTEFFFVEKSQSNFQYLKSLLGVRIDKLFMESNVRLYNESFSIAISDIVERIKSRKHGERALFLLDQYAYDQVPLPLLSRIFSSLRGAEVLLTFNVDSLVTFLSDREQSRRKLDEMGLANYVDWAALRNLKSEDPAWKALIQRQLAKGIIEQSGAKYSTIFYITPAGSSSFTYWLVHLSNVYRARDVMMELHWALANNFSHFLEPDIFVLGHESKAGSNLRHQTDLEFGLPFHFDAVAKERCRSGLTDKLVARIFDNGPQRFMSLLEALGNSTPATTSLIKEALDPTIRTKEIEAISVHGARREKGTTVGMSDIIQPAAQRPLFFLH